MVEDDASDPVEPAVRKGQKEVAGDSPSAVQVQRYRAVLLKPPISPLTIVHYEACSFDGLDVANALFTTNLDGVDWRWISIDLDPSFALRQEARCGSESTS